MLKKEHVVIGFLTFCLTTAIFMGATTSQLKPYDPWFDYLDDGKTNYEDLFYLADRYGATGTPIDKAAIVYNSTVVSTSDSTTSTSWVDMPFTSVTITLTRSSDLLIMFSTEAGVGEYGTVNLMIRARVDNYMTLPSECTLVPYFNNYMGAYAFNFITWGISPGIHTVKIQWMVNSNIGYVDGRTLAVMAVNQ